MNNSETEVRRKIKKWPFVVGGILILVIVLIVTFLSSRPTLAALGAADATAEKGYISTTVVGTGNLENDESEELELYSALEYDEVLVEAGDTVRQGDLLATVNADSVSDRVSAIQEELETLDGQINSASSGYTDKYINSKVEGRVKAIYAADNTAVQNTMNANGAIALLSLNGKMAVDFDSDGDLWIGKYVEVVLPDGTVRDGKIIKAEGGRFTATFDDKGVDADTVVTVRYEDDTVIAEGASYIADPIYVTATDGVVREIYVDENDYVYNGTSLFYVDTIPGDKEYQTLKTDREDLVEELNALMKLSQDGGIAADFDGEIAKVNITEKGSSATGSTATGGTSAGQAQTDSQAAAAGGQETAASAGTDSTASSGSSDDSKSVALTYYPLDTVSLSINIDELDVLKVGQGQPATIVFDAIEGEEFSGTITSLDKTGTVTNGNAKYKAVIELAKTDNMRAGMSATATITIEENASALLLPAAALQEYGDRIYVYTSYNSETGEFGGEQDIETGLSDGEKVEIVSGLSDGDTVYYAAAQNDESMMMFGGMGRGGSGETVTPAGE